MKLNWMIEHERELVAILVEKEVRYAVIKEWGEEVVKYARQGPVKGHGGD